MFKSEKGITLVALVITIIVLLILAGITLMLALDDNGILGQAENARMVQIEADTKETMELAILAAKTEMAAKVASNGSTTFEADDVVAMLEASLPSSGYDVTAPADGNPGEIVYSGQNYKGATDQATAELTYTWTLTTTGQTIQNGTYSTNATNSPMYVAPPPPSGT